MRPIFSEEPKNKVQLCQEFDRAYTQFAGFYDFVVKVLPFWKSWIKQAIPYIRGLLVLEVSFGTGYLLTQYAGVFETFGLDYNGKLALTANKNLDRQGIEANLQIGDVETLPYKSGTF